MNLKSLIRTVPDFPTPGIRFRDITPLLANPQAMRFITSELRNQFEGRVDKVAAIEARGFLFGSLLAHAVGAGVIPIRKPGKLPLPTIGHDYALEYGTNRVEVHTDAVARGDRVVVVDDLLATGGTARAALGLLDRLGATVVGCAFVIDLVEVGGRARLEEQGHQVTALVSFTEAD
jgi:adenine phosphoribosyltransferase